MAMIYIKDETAVMLREAAKQQKRTISATIENSLNFKKRDDAEKETPKNSKTA